MRSNFAFVFMFILPMCSWKRVSKNSYQPLTLVKNEKQNLNANVSQIVKRSITFLSKSYRQSKSDAKLILLCL